ncbi:response regulator transcription factor [Serpentinicella sp. ANB-PHB4]|uniref:response regulator transcription factor n=1 Tax=Serpentinicella sp. ANB-PHB4 TaxID=3074076 RepID=UPI00286615EA|nr:response regulator transcription factor [Serpentinicella sp. ANB-PHB4]MDR5658393.1 response regulator transcription factor [Serpentinicella sp. ANB-PHB4]
MLDKIKVLIVDDHSVVRKGLKMFLGTNPSIEVCGEAENLKDAIKMTTKTKPDVIILDFKLPDGDGINGSIAIKARFPDIKIIILTAYTQNETVLGAIRAGVDAYLLKDIESKELINTIIAVYKGKAVLDTSVTEDVFNTLKIENTNIKSKSSLSLQETKILDMIAQGKVNKEIAESLGISDKTVRNYISNIFKKLNVSNRTEAATYWIRKINTQ